MLENNSGLEPLGRAVLLKMYEPDHGGAGIIAIPDHVRQNTAVMENRGVVIAIGKACWTDEPGPRCAVGDRVIVTKMAGYVATGTKDGEIYRMVNDRDIFCKITEEKDNG